MDPNRGHDDQEYLFIRFYRSVLGCFPEGYRREYSDELLYAVRMAAAEAEMQGRLSLLRLACRELRDLPLAALRAHLQERRARMKQFLGGTLPGGPLNGWKLAAVMLPFLLPLLLTLPELLPNSPVPGVLLAFSVPLLGLLVVAWIAGLAHDFPLWSLPALGMILFFVSVIFFIVILGGVYFGFMVPIRGGWGQDPSPAVWTALVVLLVSATIVAGILPGLLRLVPSFKAQVRDEPTLLSFLLYGMSIPPLFLGDRYHWLGGYQTTALLILAVGAGLYLAVKQRGSRLLALVVPILLAELVMSLGVYRTWPVEAWANSLDASARLWDALLPLASPLPILVLLAILVPRLPWSGPREQASHPQPDTTGYF